MYRNVVQIAIFTFTVCLARAQDAQRITVEPKSFALASPQATQALLVTGYYRDGSLRDLTREASYQASDRALLEVSPEGLVKGLAAGPATILVKVGALSAVAIAEIRPAAGPPPLSFEGQIAPIFSKNGCNMSACHGAKNGQSGFRLSVFGYDPAMDYQSVVKDSNGRRVSLHNPEDSMILKKPAFLVTHGGGKRFTKESKDYQALLEWIRAGAPVGAPTAKLTGLEVFPKEEVFLNREGQQQQIVVIGRYDDGRERDLTREVNYKLNDDTVALIDANGLLSAKRSGETAVMIRSLGAVNAVRLAVSLRPPLARFRRPAGANFIDAYVFDKLAKLNIQPSAPASDGEFLRRVYLDLTGTLPAPEEVRRFLADRSADKRSRVVDYLLAQPEYGDFWSLKWGDQLTNSPQFLYNGTGYFQTWLRKALNDNMPYDEFARELITATGTKYEARPTNFFSNFKSPLDMAAATAQTFMGVSLECARCHDHPSEKWKQADFNGLAAFYGQVKRKAGMRGNESMVYVDPKAEYKHPETSQVLVAKFPGESRPVKFEEEEDRRERLAQWLTAPSNPYFAPAIVNRVWKQIMGRGIVEPEDFRITNPASHPELVQKLAEDFKGSGYSLKRLMKTIVMSNAYQLSSQVNESNQDDKTGYSHSYARHLSAEQLLDGIATVTGVPERFAAFPEGKRAIQLPDEQVESYFLTTFGRPARETATCTRKAVTNLTQSLHLINGDTMRTRLASEHGRLSLLLKEGKPDGEIVEEFTLAAFSRLPTSKEKAVAGEAVRRAGSRRRGLEDFLWAILNSREFLYNH